MTSAALPATQRAWRPSRMTVILGAAIVAGWVICVAAEASGSAAHLHHHALRDSGLSIWAATALVMVSWLAMTAAMMLPSSLPFTLLYARTARRAPHAGPAVSLFLATYFVVWTAFAAVAFLLDWLLHAAVDASPWLTDHEQVIVAGTLGLAAGFQLSPLKSACLRQCRNPGVYLMRHYRRGVLAGGRIGLAHGAFCLGCCWALMLVMFAVGVAHLAWMAVLALVMLVEKAAPWGERIVVPTAAVLGGLAILGLAAPGSVPGL